MESSQPRRAAGDVNASPRSRSMTQGDILSHFLVEVERDRSRPAEEWQAWYEACWWDGSATKGSQPGNNLTSRLYIDSQYRGQEIYGGALRQARTFGMPGEIHGRTSRAMDLEKNEVKKIKKWLLREEGRSLDPSSRTSRLVLYNSLTGQG